MDAKRDISHRADIETLVNRFYEQVREHHLLGPIFNEVAKTNWETHLPKMYAFWSGILFGESGFSGNPMQRHIDISKQTTLDEEAFQSWLELFTSTVDELFTGEKADEAKIRAANIARLMLHKVMAAKA